MTRSSSRHNDGPPCHILNFFYDDENSCALTTLVHDFRFHIIADASRLKAESEDGHKVEQQYKAYIKAVKAYNEAEVNPDKSRRRDESEAAEVHGAASDSQDSGVGDSEGGSERGGDDDTDSAVDVLEKDTKHDVKEVGVREDGVVLSDQDQENPEKALQNWMLAPFAQIFADLEPASEDDAGQQTLADWYTGPTYFYTLELQDGELQPREEDSQDDLEQRIKELVPRMSLPKKYRDLGVPWRHPNDLVVVSESDEPDPYHPSRVKVGDEIQFLKLVDKTQPQPIKRELQILKDIETKGLHKKIRVPLLLGLVGYQDSKTEIMGFLMTDIDEPTPLTKMLDSDVIEEKREKWAKETERMVGALHDNGIIWGDAKADNFMVDKHGDLWIIDFGGSYTDGWVDPELMETQEGDEMGTERIVNALQDPEANTFDPSDDTGLGTKDMLKAEEGDAESKKRSRSDDDEEDETNMAKKTKSEE